jgi:hypothetical protein
MNKTDPQSVRTLMLAHPLAPRNDPNQASDVAVVRPARIERATLGLGVPCSIQFELRARIFSALFYKGFQVVAWFSIILPELVRSHLRSLELAPGRAPRPRLFTARSWAQATT